MKRAGKLKGLMLALAAVLLLGHAVNASAQRNASIHGRVLNAIGQPLNHGDVRLSTDRAADQASRKYKYVFQIQPDGTYKGSDILPDDYVVFVIQDQKTLDYNESVKFSPDEDKQVDFDMSRADYIAKMTPEERKALDEYKKKNAEVMAANQKIANLNNLLIQARSDNKAGNYEAAATAMKQATAAKPDESILWLTLADAQLGLANKAAADAKAAGKPATDPDVVQKYQDAVASYKKTIDLNAASKKASADVAGTAYNQLGQAYVKSGDPKDAVDAYEAAVKAQPASAGMYYYNEAATLYNAGSIDEAAAAADKAIAADPKRADAYYIKGQSLIPKASVDKSGKIVAPPGCVDAYQMYLQLAPPGPRADEVKGILTGIGEKVESNYKASRKK
ncbi:MAG: tetratricopeptide repeat protein [Acidobacteriota bacterium]|nr:tetratricopeptide repeat protein [Acidobacteriota bacterium]